MQAVSTAPSPTPSIPAVASAPVAEQDLMPVVVRFRQPFRDPFGATNLVGHVDLSSSNPVFDTLRGALDGAKALSTADAQHAAFAVMETRSGRYTAARLVDFRGDGVTFEADEGTFANREWWAPQHGGLMGVVGTAEETTWVSDAGRERWRAEN
jgi:hypothetical protein